MTESITASVQLELAIWRAPNFASVVVQDPTPRGQQREGIPVRDLPVETIDRMALRWLADLYTNAGKTPPTMQARLTTRVGGSEAPQCM